MSSIERRIPTIVSVDRLLLDPIVHFRAHYETDSTSIRWYLDAVFFFLDFIKLKGLL